MHHLAPAVNSYNVWYWTTFVTYAKLDIFDNYQYTIESFNKSIVWIFNTGWDLWFDWHNIFYAGHFVHVEEKKITQKNYQVNGSLL